MNLPNELRLFHYRNMNLQLTTVTELLTWDKLIFPRFHTLRSGEAFLSKNYGSDT